MNKTKLFWACRDCGHSQTKWTGSCGGCKAWNTLTEEVSIEEKKPRFEGKKASAAKAIRICDVNAGEVRRLTTKMGELDRLFGNGIVEGSLILVAGEPGVGKSTLMLQIANSIATQGLNVLYVCGEESAEQTSLRARRLGIDHPNIYLLSETNFSAIKAQIDQINPDVAIIDSVQIVYKSELPSSPGSVVQVREIATEFMHIAKGQGITTFLIGHVTKSGEIAGPRVLEHIVDTVLDFEGDRQHGFRLLRAIKIDLVQPMRSPFSRCEKMDSAKWPIPLRYFARADERGRRFCDCSGLRRRSLFSARNPGACDDDGLSVAFEKIGRPRSKSTWAFAGCS